MTEEKRCKYQCVEEQEQQCSYQCVEEQEQPTLLGVAVAQVLARLSTLLPFQREAALVVIVLIPLLPLLGAILCFCFGQIIVASVLALVFFVIAAYVNYQANEHIVYQALPDAVRSLRFSASQYRAKSTPRYTLFLPPGPKDAVQCALLFIPGAKIHPEAYAGIAHQLSDQGILVVVQNTAPYYLPSTLVGSGQAELQSIIREVGTQYEIKDWGIGGHDMGMLPAAFLVEKLGLSKLVLWGAFSPWRVDLSESKVNVLVVMASNDGYWKAKFESDIHAFRSLLPPEAGTAERGSTMFKMIEGGNHAGFAHYGPTPHDGERTIRLEEQQQMCVLVTALFLKNAENFYYGRKSNS
jgi:Alpha/beta hydrolase family